MGGTESKEELDVVQSEVQSDPVVMYSRNSCNQSDMTRKLLSDNNISIKEVNLDELRRNNSDEFREVAKRLNITSQDKIPQVFICGRLVGGYSEVDALYKAGYLLQSVRHCSGPTSPTGI